MFFALLVRKSQNPDVIEKFWGQIRILRKKLRLKTLLDLEQPDDVTGEIFCYKACIEIEW